MIRAAVTLALFAAGADAASATDTFTATLPTTTEPFTETSTETATSTQTFTLPTMTDVSTQTSTETATSTQSFTLPTATGTETYTLPTATETFTLPTMTEEFTLPTMTSQETYTLPTQTATETYTLPTGTETFTLPTSTHTMTFVTNAPTNAPTAYPVGSGAPTKSPVSPALVPPSSPAVETSTASITALAAVFIVGYAPTVNTLAECNNLPCITYTVSTAATVGSTNAAGDTTMSMVISVTVAQIEAAAGGLAGFKATFAQDVADAHVPPINPLQIPALGITITASTARHARVLQTKTKVDYTVCKGSKSCIASVAAATTDIGTLKAIGAPIQVDADDEFPGWAIALCVVLPLLAIGGAAAAYFLLSGQDSGEAVEGEKPVGDTEPAADVVAEAEEAAEEAAADAEV